MPVEIFQSHAEAVISGLLGQGLKDVFIVNGHGAKQISKRRPDRAATRAVDVARRGSIHPQWQRHWSDRSLGSKVERG
jgi:creatinine amidohydrolase/Fe(II)-dependent formamide hydrolase-like protein